MRCVEGVYDKVIWFAATGSENTLSRVAGCAVISALNMNPDYKVVVLSFTALDPTHSDMKWTEKYLNLNNYADNNDNDKSRLELRQIEALSLFGGTPLLSWQEKASLRNGKFYKADLSDAVRTAVMWKFGGVYYDLDMISVQSVASVPVNSIGQQLAGEDRRGKVPFLNGAAMVFEPQHPFMSRVLEAFNEKWNPARFGSVGPDLLWDIYKTMRAEGELGSGTGLMFIVREPLNDS